MGWGGDEFMAVAGVDSPGRVRFPGWRIVHIIMKIRCRAKSTAVHECPLAVLMAQIRDSPRLE